MNKKFLIPLFAVLVIGSVFASVYLVNSLTLTVGIAEPFTVEYAVLGDSGNWNGVESCTSLLSTDPRWFASSDGAGIPTGNMYAGEGRGVCVKITNAGEASIPYVIGARVTNDDGNKCATAFGLPKSLLGSAGASIDTITGVGIIVDAGATPVSGCNVVIDVSRGSS